MWRFVWRSGIIAAGIGVANSLSLEFRPPIYAVGFFLWGLSLYPIARQQQPVPLARYLADGDRLVFSRYVLLNLGLAMLFMSFVGVLLFS